MSARPDTARHSLVTIHNVGCAKRSVTFPVNAPMNGWRVGAPPPIGLRM